MSTPNSNINQRRSTAAFVDVIGAPLHHGQRKPGVKSGPRRMREAGLIQNIWERGVRVNDKGDLSFEEFVDDTVIANIRNPRTVGAANRKISEAVSQSLSRGRLCLTLGGDHSLAIGSIYGHSLIDPDLAVIWVDAHADINPPRESVSGNAHGMPLAFLVDELQDRVPRGLPQFEWLKPCLSAKNITYIGLRDVDDAEKRLLDEHNISSFWMNDVKRYGIAAVVKMALDAVSPNLCRPIHLSFDIDSLDSAVAPSTGTAVTDGLSLAEGVYITEALAATGRLRVMDLAEVNPELGSEEDQRLTMKAANDVVLGWLSNLTGRSQQLTPGRSLH